MGSEMIDNIEEEYELEEKEITLQLTNSEDYKQITLLVTSEMPLTPDEYASCLEEFAKQIQTDGMTAFDSPEHLN